MIPAFLIAQRPDALLLFSPHCSLFTVSASRRVRHATRVVRDGCRWRSRPFASSCVTQAHQSGRVPKSVLLLFFFFLITDQLCLGTRHRFVLNPSPLPSIPWSTLLPTRRPKTIYGNDSRRRRNGLSTRTDGLTAPPLTSGCRSVTELRPSRFLFCLCPPFVRRLLVTQGESAAHWDIPRRRRCQFSSRPLGNMERQAAPFVLFTLKHTTSFPVERFQLRNASLPVPICYKNGQ